MSNINHVSSLKELGQRHGVEAIGAAQATKAFTVVADLGNGRVRITATAHGFLKNQCFAIVGGAYAGIYRVLNVPDANHVDVAATFGATTTGTLLKTAYLDGFGFRVLNAGAVIAAITPEDTSVSTANILARPLNIGDEVNVVFTSIRTSAGDIEVIRKPIRAVLSYTNR